MAIIALKWFKYFIILVFYFSIFFEYRWISTFRGQQWHWSPLIHGGCFASSHRAARFEWTPGEAGDREGRAYLHLSVGNLCSKSYQRPPCEESLLSAAFTTTQQERRQKKPRNVLLHMRDSSLYLLTQKFKLRWRLRQTALKKKKEEEGKKKTAYKSCRWWTTRWSHRDSPSRPPRLTWASQERLKCPWRVTRRWMRPLSEPWWVDELRCSGLLSYESGPPLWCYWEKNIGFNIIVYYL